MTNEEIAQEIWANHLGNKSMGVSDSRCATDLHSTWFNLYTAKDASYEELENKDQLALFKIKELEKELARVKGHARYIENSGILEDAKKRIVELGEELAAMTEKYNFYYAKVDSLENQISLYHQALKEARECLKNRFEAGECLNCGFPAPDCLHTCEWKKALTKIHSLTGDPNAKTTSL